MNQWSLKVSWPTKWKVLYNAKRKTSTGGPIPNSFCWRQHFFISILAIFPKMTSCDVTWRHQVGFSPKLQKMFLWLMWSCGPNLKTFFTSFKRKLWAITYFPDIYGNIYRKTVPTSDKPPILSRLLQNHPMWKSFRKIFFFSHIFARWFFTTTRH